MRKTGRSGHYSPWSPVSVRPAAKGSVTALTGLLMLSACGGASDPGGPARSAGDAPVNAASSASNQMDGATRAELQTLICSSNPFEAAALLGGTGNGSLSRFYRAVALERSGNPGMARTLYLALATEQSGESVSIKCGSKVIAEGRIGAEAAIAVVRVSAAIAEAKMADAKMTQAEMATTREPAEAMSAPALAPQDVSGDMLGRSPPDAPPAGGSEQRQAETGPALPAGRAATADGSGDIGALRSANRSGTWFVHLVSYRSLENAQAGTRLLRQQYPALAGQIETWQTSVDGAPAWRLGISLVDFAEAETVCTRLQQNGTYCAVIDRVGGIVSAP